MNTPHGQPALPASPGSAGVCVVAPSASPLSFRFCGRRRLWREKKLGRRCGRVLGRRCSLSSIGQDLDAEFFPEPLAPDVDDLTESDLGFRPSQIADVLVVVDAFQRRPGVVHLNNHDFVVADAAGDCGLDFGQDLHCGDTIPKRLGVVKYRSPNAPAQPRREEGQQ